MKRICLSLLLSAFCLLTIQAQSLKQEEFARHHISLSFLDMLMARYGFDYEYVIDPNGYFSIHMPASYVLKDYSISFTYRSKEEVKYWIGLGLNIYPTGQGKWRYFIGPELRYKSMEYGGYVKSEEMNNERVHVDPPSPYSHYQMFHNQVKLAFYINNGLLYTPTKHFALTLYLGLGTQSYAKKPQIKSFQRILPAATFGLRIGYKF